jgi:predicted permease
MSRISSLWRNLVHRDRVERDLDDEVRAAFELLVDEKRRAGLPPAEARRAATLELGGVESVKEQVRAARTGALADAFVWDVRYAARLLRRNPLFALTAALSLAIGIGATVTIFTVANGLLLRAAPGVASPDRLVDISRTELGQPLANPLLSYRTYLDLVERMSTLEGLYAHQGNLESMTMGSGGDAERIFATIVTANYFDVLGITPTAGRLFGPGDSEGRGASPIVVLSHAFWERRFNADSSLLGRTIQLNGSPFTVIGVASDGFWGTSVVSSDVWVLIDAKAFDNFFFSARRSEWGMVGGRLRSGVSTQQAAAELDAVRLALEREYPDVYSSQGFLLARASPIPPGLRFVLAGFLGLLMAMVLIVLIITCANVAGVLLARAAARRREIAVRVALGAGRARLVRQLLTETVLLFILGGASSLLLARGMTSLLLKLLPVFPVPVALSLPLDGRVLAFAIGLSLAAAVLSGLAPALHVSRADVVSGLKADSQGPSDRSRLRNAFVVAQVAFSILLVITAGVLGRAMGRVPSIDRGFYSNGIEAASIDLSEAGYTEATGLLIARELLDRLRAMPGVEAATLADQVPLRGMVVSPLRAPGVPPPAGRPFFGANWNLVDSGYFETLRIPIVAGRAFNHADGAGAQPVAIIAESGARLLWPGRDPIGQYVQWQDPRSEGRGAVTTLQIVGVARDLNYGDSGVRESRGGGMAPPIVVYVPLQQRYTPRITALMRMADGQHAAQGLNALLASINRNLPPVAVQSLDIAEAAGNVVAKGSGPVQVQLRVAAAVAGSVGLVGLFLAAIGIYGVTAYSVARRTREIGIRIAMGAQRGDIVGMVLRQGMSLVAAGSVLGLLLAAAGTRLLTRLLFGASPLDPVTFGGAVVLFAVIGLAACYVPARRATQIDAMEALRYE